MTARDQVTRGHDADGAGEVADAATSQPDARRVSGGMLAVDAAVVLGVFLVLGAVAGLVWPHLVDPVVFTRTRSGISADEVDLGRRFDNDGWFSVLGLAGGLVGGLVLMAWRRTHEVVTVLLVTAGAFLASWVAAHLGTATGPGDPEGVLAHARIGATAADRVVVTSSAAYFVWPLAAVVGALVVLWSPPSRPLLGRRRSDDG